MVRETHIEFREYKEDEDKWQKGKAVLTDSGMFIIKPKAKFDLNSMVISFMESKDGTITLNLSGNILFSSNFPLCSLTK